MTSPLHSAKRVFITLSRTILPVRRRDVAEDHSLLVPFSFADHSEARAAPRIAVVCHLFYIETAEEIRSLLSNVPGDADLLISTDTEEKRAEIRRVFSHRTGDGLRIRVMPNRGRDIAPKLVGLAVDYARYDLVLFLHSKQSAHGDAGAAWRSTLFGSLAGSKAVVSSIVQLFEQEPRLGIVMAQHFAPVREWVFWNENYPRAASLARRAGFRVPFRGPIDFPSGSMFWARPDALRPLLDLGLTSSDFPLERGQINRTLHHALERLFLFSCEHSGFDWVKVSHRGAPIGEAPVTEARSWSEVRSYLDDRLWRTSSARSASSSPFRRLLVTATSGPSSGRERSGVR